jgi:hypothetical protein
LEGGKQLGLVVLFSLQEFILIYKKPPLIAMKFCYF